MYPAASFMLSRRFIAAPKIFTKFLEQNHLIIRIWLKYKKYVKHPHADQICFLKFLILVKLYTNSLYLRICSNFEGIHSFLNFYYVFFCIISFDDFWLTVLDVFSIWLLLFLILSESFSKLFS